MQLIHPLRSLLLGLAFLAFCALPSMAQQGQASSTNPTASSVHEKALLDQLDRVTGRITIPNKTAGTLIQPEGRDWRQWQQNTIPTYGAYILAGMLVLLVLFFLIRGRIRVEKGWSGIKVRRFGGFERFVHWFTAVSFIILGLTGLNIVFGRTALLPLVGAETFATLTQWGKYAHNYLGIPFAIGIVLMLLLWVWGNLPSTTDLRWIASGGGLLGSSHPPAKRFNFGQKLIFWSVILIGGAIAASGFVLLFPFQEGTNIADMQFAQIIHSIGGIVLIAIILAHIYIGTLGMEGAFEAMGSGDVDLNWAKEHHSLWAEKARRVEGEGAPASGHRMAPAE
jgi:formate dehydrogenase subunit gamma